MPIVSSIVGRVSLVLPITRTLARLRRTERGLDSLVIQLVPVALRPATRQVAITPAAVEIELE